MGRKVGVGQPSEYGQLNHGGNEAGGDIFSELHGRRRLLAREPLQGLAHSVSAAMLEDGVDVLSESSEKRLVHEQAGI